MKKTLLFLLSFAIMAGAMAQTQKGTAKTKKGYVREVKENNSKNGGLDYSPLAKVAIKITGNIGTESNNFGKFELSPNESSFRLVDVRRTGFKLITPSDYTNTYTCTSELLEIIMVKNETWNRKNQDKQTRAENNINKEKSNELEMLYQKRDNGRLSESEYFKQLNEINKKYKQLIEKTVRFVEQYTSDYFRGLDSIDKQLNDFLIEGRIHEFDSLMRLKGDFSQREEEIKLLNNVEQAYKTAKRKKIEYLASDYFREAQKYNQLFNQDSALYYLIKRSLLDTTNVRWLDEVAIFCSENIGDYKQVMSYYNKIKTIWEKGLRPGHPAFILLYTNMAATLKEMGKYQEALGMYDNALNAYNTADRTEKKDLIWIYNGLGNVYNNMQDNNQALVYFNKAVEVCNQLSESDEHDLGIIYNNMAGAYFAMKYYDKALEIYNEVIGIYNRVLSPNDVSFAVTYGNIGNIYRHKKDYDQALAYQSKAKNIKEQVLSPTHPDLAITYFNIGSIYQDKGDYDQALVYYDKAKKIEENILDEKHPKLAATYGTIGLVYEKKGDYNTALEYYNRVLGIYESGSQYNNENLWALYVRLEFVYEAMKSYTEALEYCNKILVVLEQDKNADKVRLAEANNNLGRVFYKVGNYEQSLKWFNRTLVFLKKYVSENGTYIKAVEEAIETVKQKMQEQK